MKKITRVLFIAAVSVLLIYLLWSNQYSQKALRSRVFNEWGFNIVGQSFLKDFRFEFNKEWLPKEYTPYDNGKGPSLKIKVYESYKTPAYTSIKFMIMTRNTIPYFFQ